MNKIYSRIQWENYPSILTPINEINLNHMDYAIDSLDDSVVLLDTVKADKSVVLNTINDWSMDSDTGIITITKVNGEQIIFDLNIEKIPVSFTLSEDGILKMTTDDGSEFVTNISDIIPILTFENSDTIAVKVTSDGINKSYSFEVKDGSITEDKLQPNYLANVQAASNSAIQASSQAIESAHTAVTSETNSKVSETNAKASEEAAKQSEVNAKASEVAASLSENNSKTSEENALTSETNAKASEEAAKQSEVNAKASEEALGLSEVNAKASEEAAKISETNSNESALLSKSYAVGTTGTRENEDVDNAKYYMEEAKKIAESGGGGGLSGWTGTTEEYEAEKDNIMEGMVINITDDYDDTPVSIIPDEESLLQLEESGKIVDALINKKLLTNLGGYSFHKNPSVVYLVDTDSPYTDENGEYILANSVTGQNLLSDTEVYKERTIAGDYCQNGADSVHPFRSQSADLVINISAQLRISSRTSTTSGSVAFVDAHIDSFTIDTTNYTSGTLEIISNKYYSYRTSPSGSYSYQTNKLSIVGNGTTLASSYTPGSTITVDLSEIDSITISNTSASSSTATTWTSLGIANISNPTISAKLTLTS